MNQYVTRYKTENGKTHKVKRPVKAGNKTNVPDISTGTEITTQPGAPAK